MEWHWEHAIALSDQAYAEDRLKVHYREYQGFCASLALLHAKGDGVPKDTARAAALYGKACDGGRSAACNNLGVLYITGDGVPKDAARAAVLYDRACQGGNASGCSNLGGLYKTGDGVGADAARADALFQKACDGGYASACGRREQGGAPAAARPPGDGYTAFG